jgi:glycosyltransferase involved in cell wall biosynthesis
MNIAIDMRRQIDFGVATYVRNILRTLARIDGAKPDFTAKNRYILIGQPERLRDFRGYPENFVLQAFPKPAGSVGSALGFRRILQRHNCDLLHVPHTFKTPRFAPCPYVVTVHDLLGFLYKDPKQTPMQSRIRFELAKHAVRGASRILAVSNSTKADVQRFFGVRPERIEVAYNAIDERFQEGHANEADRQFIAERYQVNYPFLLYAGNIKPHKNVVRVIEAFSALKAELKKTGQYPDLKLIIIGDEVSSHPDLRRTVIRSGVQNDVRFLGFVPVETLRIFYDVAKVFVFPSLYEGFGLPPLEAMAHGTPVVTSNVSSLPEVVGDAAVMVHPENVFEIMHAIHRVLLDQRLRDELKVRGYMQATKYSWERTARVILAVYEKAATPGSLARVATMKKSL